MKVKKLIEKLQTLNPNAEVKYVWDGAPRSDASYVWVSQKGTVLLCDENEYVDFGVDTPEGMKEGILSFRTGRQCAMHFNRMKK